MLPRRLLLAALLVGTLPLARSAPNARKYRLGFFGIGNADSFFGEQRKQLLDALAGLGYVHGANLEVAECYEMDSPEKLAACAQQLADLRVDAILTEGTTATLMAQKATRAIPIVTTVGDPVAAGFAQSVRRPGGNITGLTQNRAEIARKTMELLRIMRPRVAAIGLLWEPPFPGIEILMKPVVEAARELSIATHEVTRGRIRFTQTLEELRRLHIDDAYDFSGLQPPELEAAVRARVAVVTPDQEGVEGGALLSVVPDASDSAVLAARMIDQVLRGAKPAEMPFQSATRYVTHLNGKTARALGIPLTPELRLRVDRIVE